MPQTRALNLAIALFCLGLILFALYLQEIEGLTPCYLCIVQRAFIIAAGVISLAAVLHNPGVIGRRIYAAFTALMAVAGGGFAIRQLWLQSLPEEQVPACGPPADYLFESFPLMEVVFMLLQGDGNCAKIQWTLLGLSIPAWTLVAFAAIALAALWLLFRTDRATSP